MDLQTMKLIPGESTPAELFLAKYSLFFNFFFIFILGFIIINLLLKIFKIKTNVQKRLVYILFYTIGGTLIGYLGMNYAGWRWWSGYEVVEPFTKYFGFSVEKRFHYYLLIKSLTSFGLAIYSLILNFIFFKGSPRSKLIVLALTIGLLTNPLWIATLNLGKYLRQFVSFFYYKYIFLTH